MNNIFNNNNHNNSSNSLINRKKIKRIKLLLVSNRNKIFFIAIVAILIFMFKISRIDESTTRKLKFDTHKKLIEHHRNRVPKKDYFNGLYATFETIPFYSNASGIVNQENNELFKSYFCTIITQTSIDRLYKVGMMADKWKAPLSVSIFMRDGDTTNQVDQALQKNPSLLYYADIHLLFSNNTRYPVNNLRNLAVNNSRTDLVFIMDADFLPPLGLHDYILQQKQFFDIRKSNHQQFVSNLLNFNYKKVQPVKSNQNQNQHHNGNKNINNSNNNNNINNQNHKQHENQNNINIKLNDLNKNQDIYNSNKNNNQFDNSHNSNSNSNSNNLLKENIDSNSADNEISKVNGLPTTYSMDEINSISDGSSNTNLDSNSVNDSEPLKVAFVVPSFSSSELPENLPDDKQEMIEMINSNKVSPSNLRVCPKCHSPTNFTRWMNSSTAYEVEYKWIFEPYLVFNKSQAIPFDERLKGYGFDKNSHAFSLAVEGFHFIVLPESFIIHVNHPSSSWEGPSLEEQQWDALRIVCEIVPSIKYKNHYDPNLKVFDEPLPNECFSNLHW